MLISGLKKNLGKYINKKSKSLEKDSNFFPVQFCDFFIQIFFLLFGLCIVDFVFSCQLSKKGPCYEQIFSFSKYVNMGVKNLWEPTYCMAVQEKKPFRAEVSDT
jgi:hypothetical protein